MQGANQLEEEVGSAILAANFPKAVQLSQEWLQQITVEQAGTVFAKKISDAFLISRFFLHRQERLNQIPSGIDRARLFLALLTEYEKSLADGGIDPSSIVSQVGRTYIHAQVADGLARDFAGQKAYNLNQDEILQLAFSLIEIEKFKSAEDVLLFMYRHNRKSPQVNYLLAYISYRLHKENDFYHYFRDALFFKPEIVSVYPKYLPGGIFTELYQRVAENGHTGVLRDRYFALLAEVNGLYPIKLSLNRDEIIRIEGDFRKIRADYVNTSTIRDELFPRVLQYLCWLVLYYTNQRDFDKVEEFRQEMLFFSEDIWESFAQKNLK